MSATWILTLLVTIWVRNCIVSANSLRICAYKQDENNCRFLEAAKNDVRCVIVEDTVDCLLKLDKDVADFGVLTAEEALVAAAANRDLKVVAEVRHKNRTNDPFDFRTVVVVKASHIGGISGLRQKNYCHPGFSRTQYWTDPVLKAFEKKILPSCSTNETEIESETRALGEFFNQSCRPGTWTINKYMDGKLKARHRNLCSLCDNSDQCSYITENVGTHYAALRCLTEKNGDVAYSSLQAVSSFFRNSNATNYNFLCLDGSTQPVTDNLVNPCAWIKQPWSTVVAPTRIANTVNGRLKDIFPESIGQRSSVTWSDRLRTILEGDSGALQINSSSPLISLTSYVSRGRELETTPSPCSKHDIKWCTTSYKEKEKCQLLATASNTHGISPRISCPIPAANITECLKYVNTSDADIAVVPTNLGFIARSAYNLDPLMYIESERIGNYYGVAIVNANSTVKSITDLKGKSACFPTSNGLGWLTFMQAAWKAGALSASTCPTSLKALDFFGDSCVPGVMDRAINIQNLDVPDKLCAACNRNGGSCESSSNNPFYGDLGALRCLQVGGGEVAFVDYSFVKKWLATPKETTGDILSLSNFRAVCKDGSLSQLENLNEENCAINQLIGTEVLTKKSQSKQLSRDIQFALEQINDWFGSNRPRSIIKLFGPFDNVTDALFPAAGVDLLNVYATEGVFVHDYAALHSQLQHCSPGSRILTDLTILLVSMFALLVHN